MPPQLHRFVIANSTLDNVNPTSQLCNLGKYNHFNSSFHNLISLEVSVCQKNISAVQRSVRQSTVFQTLIAKL